jgi:hypothetical protein
LPAVSSPEGASYFEIISLLALGDKAKSSIKPQEGKWPKGDGWVILNRTRRRNGVKKFLSMALGGVLLFTFILQAEPVGAEGPPSGISRTSQGSSNWQAVEKTLGRPGVEQGDMFKITFPRTDLNVTVNGIPIEPGLALASWFAFKPMPKGTMVMGDMALLDEEVPKVLVQLIKGGFEVSAIHNHLLNESPSIKHVHISGHGSRANLAQSLKVILSFTGTPLRPSGFEGQAPPAGAKTVISAPTPDPSMNSGQGWSKVQAILGPGKVNGRVLQYGFPRAEAITEKGMEIPPFMGMATSINLQRVGGMALGEKGPLGLPLSSKSSRDVVAATGDFVLTAGEVNPVVESLTQNHITVTAIHSHMLEESPRLFFLHFWALGSPSDVAAGLKEALEKVQLAEMK